MTHVAGLCRVMRASLPRLALSAARPALSLTPLTHGLPTTFCSGWAAAAVGVVRARHTFVVDPQGTCVDEDDSKPPQPQRMPADAEPHLLVCAFGHDRTGTLSLVTAAIRKHSGSIMQAVDPPSDTLLAIFLPGACDTQCVGRRRAQSKSMAIAGHSCWIATLWTPTIDDHLVRPAHTKTLPPSLRVSGARASRRTLMQ